MAVAKHLGDHTSTPFSAKPHKRFRTLRRIAWLALLAALAVEGFTRVHQHHARKSLTRDARRVAMSGGQSGRHTPFARASNAAEWEAILAHKDMAAAIDRSRRHVRSWGRRRHSRMRHSFAELAATQGLRALQDPSVSKHVLAARLYQSAGDGAAAARHWQFASRLAPTDVDLSRRADSALTLAMAHRARPATRTAGGAGLGFLLLSSLLGGFAGTCHKKRLRYVDSIRGSVRMVVDGDGSQAAPTLDKNSSSLLVDVLLRGRYGLAPKCMRRKGPTMQITCSHPEASKSLRLRPTGDVRGDAVRVQVTPDTLKRLKSEPGTWRMFVQLDDRCIATAPLHVQHA